MRLRAMARSQAPNAPGSRSDSVRSYEPGPQRRAGDGRPFAAVADEGPIRGRRAVAPLHESVPPKLYGGTERVVSWLTEGLVAMGHDVTLFASADSESSATLVPAVERALRLDERASDPVAHHLKMVGSPEPRRRRGSQ